MGSNFINRISQLQDENDESKLGRISFSSAFFASFLGLFVLSYILPVSKFPSNSESIKDQVSDSITGSSSRVSELAGGRRLLWLQDLDNRVNERAEWLENSLFGGSAGDRYFRFSQGILNLFIDSNAATEESLFDPDSWFEVFKETLVSIILRVGFVAFSFWPLWIFGAILGYIGVRAFVRPKRTDDLLGICHLGKGPFYSGIYGPLRSNNGLSATDLSCPGLASPRMVKRQVAFNHPLGKILRDHNALNETNLALVQVILAYKHYPSFVEDENIDTEDPDDVAAAGAPAKEKPSGFIAQVDETIEQRATETLTAVLEAYQAIHRYYQQGNLGVTLEQTERRFLAESKALEALTASRSPLSKMLVAVLTPLRRNAVRELPVTAIASACLALEAGKCLVYKEVGNGFSTVSRFPHLQARAVIHSLVSYQKEYSGDLRLQIRQAIICSRRHGDFGRVFVPHKMPTASRGLRDWLEILYSTHELRQNTAELTELDAHLAELHSNWREKFSSRLMDEHHKNKATEKAADGDIRSTGYSLQNGMVYKSVVLLPLKILLGLALRDIGHERLQRMTTLIEGTREQYRKLRVSARLPGYRRQTLDLDKDEADMKCFSEAHENDTLDQGLLAKWIIIRRMLMHYNWLSTRVGDDSVPSIGLVQAVVVVRGNDPKPDVVGLDALIPLRQTRIKDLLGAQWERHFFGVCPHPDDIELCVDEKVFKSTLEERMKQAAKGELNSHLGVSTAA